MRQLWQEKDGKIERSRKYLEDLVPTGWTDWWLFVEHQLGPTQRSEKQTKAKIKKENYSNLVLPNQLLLGWRGWWSRMEAEGRKDRKVNQKNEIKEKLSEKISKMKPIDTFFKRSSDVESLPKGRKESVNQNSARIFSSASNGQIFSPKRKSITNTLTLGASPGRGES